MPERKGEAAPSDNHSSPDNGPCGEKRHPGVNNHRWLATRRPTRLNAVAVAVLK
jgi:hypothetical protein